MHRQTHFITLTSVKNNRAQRPSSAAGYGPRPGGGRSAKPLSESRAALLETLRAQAEPTTLAALVALSGLHANTVIGAYGMSKAADHMLVKNLAAEWGPKNVRVNAIAPGLIKTDFAKALWEDPKRRAEREAATPLRRLGEPSDIGGIAVFLASDAAAFITGQCIVADGGVTIL